MAELTGSLANSGSGLSHSLNVDSVRVEDERTVIVVVIATQSRRTVVGATRSQRWFVELIDLHSCLSNEREVGRLSYLRVADDPEQWLVQRGQLGDVRKFGTSGGCEFHG